MEAEAMKKLKATVEKCLDELAKKNDLTPAETKAALDGMELRDLLRCEIEDCKTKEEMEYAERGYSRSDAPYRQYHITSYGHPMHFTGNQYSMRPMRVSYDGPMNGYSGDYGVQGWYRSGDGMSNCGPDPYYYGDRSYRDNMNGYSRHSIGDQVIQMLEKKMDTTDSAYEREELKKFMRMIRSAAD